MAYEDIIAQLTLEEKCTLLQGASAFGTLAIPSLDIPELQFSDGPHGMRHQDPNGSNHLGIGGSLPATCFPTAAAVAQSWDPSLGERLGVALGEEAACQGVGCVLGPGLNIKRSPLTGRNFEYFSEDPLLAGKMAAAYVRGIQSQGVAACPKHFAANSQETRRQASDSVVDERTLRELYLAGFETVVREADPWCIMSCATTGALPVRSSPTGVVPATMWRVSPLVRPSRCRRRGWMRLACSRPPCATDASPRQRWMRGWRRLYI